MSSIPNRSQPLVSIVMPSFNQAPFIERALDSVLQQSWQHLEVIVQDGGSSDGTQAVLFRIAERDSRLRWFSETDSGPADAINKALKRVRGTYVGWLNSDDCYTPGAVERAVNQLQNHPEWMLCYGQGQHIDGSGEPIALYPTLPAMDAPRPVVPPPSAFQQGCFICQPTVFFKTVMLRLLGPLDTNLKASFDFDYWLRAFNSFAGRIGYVPAIQACSRLHENTITHSQRLTVALEGMKLLAKHQGIAPAHWLISYFREQRQAGVDSTVLKQELDELLPTANRWLQPHDMKLLHRLFDESSMHKPSKRQ